MNGFFHTGPRTENLTVLLTDIKGFTQRTASQSRDESADWLARHEALLAPVVRFFGGVRRKDIGDAWMVTFASPTDAVRCAMAVQDRLWAYNRLVEENQGLQVRAVLTQGEVQIRGKELIGEAVTAALGLEGSAEAGEVVLSESVYLAMNRKEAPTEEIGQREIESLPEPMRLYRAARVTHSEDGPPYGNRSLPPPPQLDAVDASWLATQREDTSSQVVGASKIVSELQPLGRRVKDGLAPMTRAASGIGIRRVALAGTGAAVSLGVILLVASFLVRLVSADPVARIERSIDAGNFDEASSAMTALLEEMPERVADLRYLEGYLAWKQERFADSASAYRRAIREDRDRYANHPRLREHMISALGDDSCSVRRAAAETMAASGNNDFVPHLQAAIEAESGRSRGPLGLGRLRCDFAFSARRAIRTLDPDGEDR